MKNKKGFTLVEIIISIAIGSIVLMIAGSMLVSAFQFLFSTTDTDLDKRAVDSLIDVVRTDVKYAYDVRLLDHKDGKAADLTIENGWHHYYVDNDVLYRDDVELLDSSYYNGKKFSLKANADFKNEIRIDFTYQLINDENENAYSARDTIMFLNISSFPDELREEGLYLSASEGGPQLTKSKYWFYFKGTYDNKTPSKPETAEGDGTVADQLKSMTIYTNRWKYDSTYFYRYGDRVFHNGYWWLYNSTTNGGADFPGQSSSFWKRLTREWTENSKYSIGDIIIGEDGNYYQMFYDIGYNANPKDPYNGVRQWKIITEEEAKKNTYDIQKNEYYQWDQQTVVHKLDAINLNDIPIWEQQKNDTYPALGNQMPTKSSDFVKIKDTEVTGEYYHYYYRVFNNNAYPGEKSSDGYFGWQELKLDYDSNSAYIKGDSILSIANGGSVKSHFKAQYDIVTPSTINSLKEYLTLINRPYDPSSLYNNYLNPGNEFNYSFQYIWKKLY